MKCTFQLHLHSAFFQAFNRPFPKCNLLIPHTLLVTKGNPSCWLFTSRKLKEGHILKKKAEKTNFLSFMVQILSKYNSSVAETIMHDTKMNEKNIPESLLNEDMLWMVTANDRKLITCSKFLEMVNNTTLIGDACFQQIIRFGTSSETYFVEYEMAHNNRPSLKMTITVHKKVTGSRHADSQIKVLSQQSTQHLTLQTQRFASYLTTIYPIVSLKRAKLRFNLGANPDDMSLPRMYFMGCEQMYVAFKIELPKHVSFLMEESQDGVHEMDQLIKGIKNRVYPKVQLLKFNRRVKRQECPGQFCNILLTSSQFQTSSPSEDLLPRYIINQELIQSMSRVKERLLGQLKHMVLENVVPGDKLVQRKKKMYYNTKVCKNCFVIYSLGTEMIADQLKVSERSIIHRKSHSTMYPRRQEDSFRYRCLSLGFKVGSSVAHAEPMIKGMKSEHVIELKKMGVKKESNIQRLLHRLNASNNTKCQIKDEIEKLYLQHIFSKQFISATSQFDTALHKNLHLYQDPILVTLPHILDKYHVQHLYTSIFSIFQLDQATTITYILVGNNAKEIVILCHDLFDNALQYYEEATTWAQLTNKSFLLVNLPGQAFTICQEDQPLNCSFLAKVIDSLLFHLTEINRIDVSAQFMMIGVGFGSLILSHLILSSGSSMTSLRQILFFNPLSKIERSTRETLKECLRTYGKHMGQDNKMMAYHFHSSMVNRKLHNKKQLQKKSLKNPIFLSCRTRLLQGIMSSPDISKWFERIELPAVMVYSSSNTMYHSTNFNFGKRHLPLVELNIQGGCAVLEDNPVAMSRIIREFITS